ncbi:transglutaminase domain-containing protein [uncultured Peptoniphilus sp.]|uniref:transglutaminase domain-containing protein n=1 Tax=uncultured Peptoniphilus sp. TaxID=254354 RepID=UPI00258AC248|nr:transglutaminase domain-containing protein [uncultured Peptoniphilus sp.]MDU6784339.1 transglutaminase domain-containing protein [Peptoniphilus harei]
MEKCEILTSKKELGLVEKKAFYEARDKEAYKPITIKINEELKNFLEQTKGRHGIDKEFIIPGSSTLNNLLVVRVEDIRYEGDYYECDLLVQFFAEKEDFKDLMELEERIKGKLDEGLTDLEKDEFLNTYIAENISYDKEHKSRSALAAAISHKGTCVAFSQLFLILGEAKGRMHQ